MPIPQNAVTKAIKIFDLTSPEKVAKDGGTITGSPTFSRDGCDLDGTNDYITYTIPNTLMASAKISIVVEFTPDFAYDYNDIISIYSSTSNQYRVYKHNNAGNNVLGITLGGQLIEEIASASYSTYWKQNERNVLEISGTTGATNAWLNGTQILTNDAQAWSVTNPTELYAGCLANGTQKFDGEIHSISIHNDLLTGDDA